MSTPSVLIMQEDSLLSQTLTSIIKAANPAVSVVASEAIDLDGLMAEISILKPSAILLRESMMLAAEDNLMHLLVTLHHDLRVIIVSEDSNWLYIFRKEEMLLTRTDDLLNIINSG